MSLNYPFWVNDFDRVKDHKLKFPLASKIFQYPVSFWYGERNGKEMEKIDYSIQRLLRRTHPQLPILVVYNMPNRDIGTRRLPPMWSIQSPFTIRKTS